MKKVNRSVDKTIPLGTRFHEEDLEQPIGEGENINDERNRFFTKKKITITLIGIVLVSAIVIISVYFLTKAKNIPTTITTQEESLASLIKVAPFFSGAILLEFTELLDDPTTLYYYINIQDFSFTTDVQPNNIENVNLYLTASSNPVATGIHEDKSVKIANVANVEFPFRLSDGFLPGDYNGILLLEEDTSTFSIVELGVASFDLIVDPSQNIGSSVESQELTGSPTSSPTARLTFRPTPRLTPAPMAPQLPPILFSEITGDYNIGGTITIDYISNFVDGIVVSQARMRFNLPKVASAPGPFLYLSKRPYSETRGKKLDRSDIPIPIDESQGGSFTVEGNYDQALDEISNIQNLSEYANGSWIVWCEPFGVWIGGGPISPQS